MEAIKINVEVSVNLKADESLMNFANLICSLTKSNGGQPAAKEVEQPESKPTQKKKKQAAAPAEQPAAEQPAAEQPAAEQPAAEQPAAEQPAAAAEQVSFETLRGLAFELLKTNRNEIIKKMNDFGVDRLSNLDKSDYPAMYEFLKSLKNG